MKEEVKTMKYIKNTGRIAIAFTIIKNEREVKISLDRRRLYRDTGNIASDGITPVEEADIKELEKQKLFNALVEEGSLEILGEEEVRTPDENKIKTLEDENKRLQEELKKAENPDVKKMQKENKTLADENADLKARLEALTKAQTPDAVDTGASNEADTEGF